MSLTVRDTGEDGANVVELGAADFTAGTYVIRTAGVYRLTEDISFEPNASDDWMPTQAQFASGAYDRQAFQVGFFAAIAVAADDVVIDLNGHTIEQSAVHALQQRFFACIEGGASPFIDNAGPLDFVTDEFRGVQRLTIKNGTLGRSSHHGFHANECVDLTMQDMTIRDFEVAAIHVNRGLRCTCTNVAVPRNRTDIPVLGSYSGARFIRIFIDTILQSSELADEDVTRGAIVRAALQQRMDATLASVRASGRTVDPLFANPSGLIDGSAYAIVVNGRGPAVNDFGVMPATEDERLAKMSRDMVFRNVTVGTMLVQPRQIIGLSTVPDSESASAGRYGGGVQKDPAGAVLQIEHLVDSATGAYVGNELADAQLFVAEFRALLPAGLASRVTISDAIVAWSKGAAGAPARLSDVMAADQTVFRYNGDSMFHVMKGGVACRFDQVDGLLLEHVRVAQCWNNAHAASVMAGDDLDYEYGHPQQTQLGYQGCTQRGITMSACMHVQMDDVAIDTVGSTHGFACALDVMNETTFSRVNNVRIASVHSLARDAIAVAGQNMPAGVQVVADQTIATDSDEQDRHYGISIATLVLISVVTVLLAAMLWLMMRRRNGAGASSSS